MMNMKNYQILKKDKLNHKYKPMNLRLEDYDFKVWFTEEEKSADTTLKGDGREEIFDIPIMPPPEGAEVVKEGTGIKILTPNKVLTRL